MLAWLTTKLKRAESSRAELLTSRVERVIEPRVFRPGLVWSDRARALLEHRLVALWACGDGSMRYFNRYSGIRVWILIFHTRFKNIHIYQVLSISVSMGTGSYPKPCPTGFLSAGTWINHIHCHPYSQYPSKIECNTTGSRQPRSTTYPVWKDEPLGG
jgi:hypothetical protein